MRSLVIVALAVACSHGADPLDEFHRSERHCLTAFNAALAEQRAGTLDELGLAERIDRDVLPEWRTMRAHVTAATLPDRMREPMAKYLADRQAAWEAFAAGLHANDRSAYDIYHQKDADADADARVLGPLLR